MKGTKTKRKVVRLAMTVVVALSVGVAPHAGAGGVAGCDGERLRTLKIKMAVARDSYARGEVAKVRVKVTREVAGYETAVEGTHVVVTAQAGESVLLGGAITGEDGKTVVKVKVLRFAPTGPAHGFGYAWREIAQAPCFDAREDGHIKVARLFRITR